MGEGEVEGKGEKGWDFRKRDQDGERLRLSDVIRFAEGLKILDGKIGCRNTKWEGVVIVEVKDDVLS